METVEVYNIDGDKVVVPVRLIESVRKPGISPDHGALGFLSGRTLTFGRDGEAEKVILAMTQYAQGEAKRGR